MSRNQEVKNYWNQYAKIAIVNKIPTGCLGQLARMLIKQVHEYYRTKAKNTRITGALMAFQDVLNLFAIKLNEFYYSLDMFVSYETQKYPFLTQKKASSQKETKPE
jgi:hypothetical protein